MELVYPIYLDNPMMTGFLASLENGLIEEADVQSHTIDSEENTRGASFGLKLSQLLSQIAAVEAQGNLGRKLSESLESQYKSTVRFPTTALFIRLRDLLIEQTLVKVISSIDQFDDISIGDLVEVQGLAIPNPNYQIRRFVEQIFPIVQRNYELQAIQLEQQINLLKDTKPNIPIKLGNNEITFKTNQEIKERRAELENQQQNMRSEVSGLQMISTAVADLFPVVGLEPLVFKGKGLRVISQVYPAFARNERINDMYDATWHCIGKVIGIIPQNGYYDLLKDSPISYLVKDQFSQIANALNNQDINIRLTEPKVNGPALVVSTLAVFA